MSDCLIRIKIGDQEILLDPNSDISEKDLIPLGKTIPADKLRAIYSMLKSNLTLDNVIRTTDRDLINKGKNLYKNMVGDSDQFLSIIAAINKETDPEILKALTAYASSLDGGEILEHGNFMINPEHTYKASPYSNEVIRSMVFSRDGAKVKLFDSLMSLPGMETVKISIAYATEWNGQPLETVKGSYITPDNIIQIVVPFKKKGYQVIDNVRNDIVTERNLTSLAKGKIQDVLLHELTHAVYSELYNSDNNFQTQIDNIHSKFLKYQTGKGKTDMYNTYKDVHEFIAGTFTDHKLHDSLSKIAEDLTDDEDKPNLLNAFTEVISSELLLKDNLLKHYISMLGNNLPHIHGDTVLDLSVIQENSKDRESIFYLEDVDDFEVDENMSPKDQTDSYYSNNTKAFYLNKRFQKKYKENTFKRDAYYKATIKNPTNTQIDTLYRDDVILLPWLRYKKAVKAEGKRKGTPGEWIEIGIVIDKNGKPVKTKDGKNRTADIIRVDGKIQKTKDGFDIEEALQSFPVLYSNIKKQSVTVSKPGAKLGDKFNTFSFPYNLVKGIRKLDHKFFDHNDDYETQLQEAKDELARVESLKGDTENKFDNSEFYRTRVEQLTKNVEKAAKIKQELIDLHIKYGFSHEIDGKIYTNVSEEDYLASPYTKERIEDRVFAEEPITMLKKGSGKTKDGKDKFITYPNPKIFDLFWTGEIGKEYAKTSEQVGEAVAKGDLIRIRSNKTFDIKDSDEKTSVRMAEWVPVHSKTANGILIATKNGTGRLIPFNTIEAYAKNRTTDEYKLMLADYFIQINNFTEETHHLVPDKDGKLVKKHNKENISFRSFQFDEDYNVGKNEKIEAAIERFDKNLEKLKKKIKPNESFVRIKRRFVNDEKKMVEYQVNGIVLAKTDESLIVLTENKGTVRVESIRFDSKLDSKDKSGAELMFLMESTAKINKLWKEYSDEKEQYKKNKKEANFKFSEGNWYKLQDPKLNPHSIYDEYDFYDNINGITLGRLKEGDVVAIPINKSKMTEKEAQKAPENYFRKVLRVLDDGTVIVADYANNDITYKNNYTIKKGTVYPRYLKPDQIARLGFKLGAITEDENGDFHSQYNEDLLNRRKKLWEYSKRDRDFTNFTFAKSLSSVQALNRKVPKKGMDYWRYIPLTNKILDPNTKETEEYYIDKKFNRVDNVEKAAYVIATFAANSDNLKYVNRGILVKTSMIYKSVAMRKDSDGKLKFKQELLDKVMPGDWVTTKNAKDEYWDAVIERVDGDNIYVLNTDLTTTRVNPERVYGIRLSSRNEKFSGFTRSEKLIKALKQSTAETQAKHQKRKPKAKDNPNKPSETTLDEEPPFSLDTDYKSPKSSRRAILEIGNRLKDLNPDININYAESEDISNLVKMTGYDYNQARAFILQGEVFINMDKASVSDVIHEYAHLFLHTLKYENPDMYDAIIQVTNAHPLYYRIAEDYPHLDKTDLDEEVFVTILGEYMGGKMALDDKSSLDDSKELLLDFANYTKAKLSQTLNRGIDNIYDIDPTEILNMSFEDVIRLVGDQIMNTRITSVQNIYPIENSKDIETLKRDLINKGLLTEQCYG